MLSFCGWLSLGLMKGGFEVLVVVVDFGLWVLGGRVEVCWVDGEEKGMILGASFMDWFPAPF